MKPNVLFLLLFQFVCSVVVAVAAGEGSATVSADSLWFGRVETGTPVTDTVWVKRATGSGQTDLAVVSAHIVARDRDFTLVSAPAGESVGDSAAVVVLYRSRHNVLREGVLFIRVRDAGAEYSLPVRLAGASYYAGTTYSFTENLSGAPLLASLREYTQGHTALTYNQARDLMFESIDKRADDSLECPYSGRTIKVINRQDAQVNHNFNTEHTWPQSLGAENEPPKSDLYHLRATDLVINDKRANYPFGYVVSGVKYELNGSKLGNSATGSTIFEVRDRYKGDIARGLFYFAVCYNNPSSFLNQQESDMRQWSAFDTVDAEEAARNSAIAQWQKRRNPFIDHPEFLERIYSISGRADFPAIADPVFADTLLVFAENDGTELPVLLGNRGTDTAFVRTAEVEYQSQTGTEFVVAVDSVVAPNGFARIVVRRPSTGTGDSLRLTVKFKQGVSSQSTVLALRTTVGVSEQPGVMPEMTASPNPFGEWTLLSARMPQPCAGFSLRVYTQLGEEVQNLAPLSQWSDGKLTVRFVPPAGLSTVVPLYCRLQCGDQHVTYPLLRLR
jgi:deoxyribonuclease-1